jgi:hypothetical protein
MSSKQSVWIEQINNHVFEDVVYKEEMIYWKDVLPTLKRIDDLLFRAMLEVENVTLSDDIEKELNGTS